MTDPLTLVVAVLAALTLVLTLVVYRSVQVVLRRKPDPLAPTPKMSVLKPVKGVDEGLLHNLRALCEQDYPDFEILIGAEDRDDPALVVARQVQREYPERTIRIFAGAPTIGLNPKVNNLSMLAEAAAHDVILISDSNVRPRSGYLRAMAAELADERVGLVWSLLAGVGSRSTGATLENLQLNSFIAAAVCGADVLSPYACVIGKSILLRKHQLEELGGFRALSNVLAEDYVVGQLYLRAGYKVALSPYVLDAVHEHRTVLDFAARHLRWSQMRRWIHPGMYLLEPLLNPTLWLLMTLLVASGGGGIGPLSPSELGVLAGGGLLVKAASDAHLSWLLTGNKPAAATLLWVTLKDVVIAAVWAMGLVRRRVVWRGNLLRIGPGSVLARVHSESPQVAAVESA